MRRELHRTSADYAPFALSLSLSLVVSFARSRVSSPSRGELEDVRMVETLSGLF